MTKRKPRSKRPDANRAIGNRQGVGRNIDPGVLPQAAPPPEAHPKQDDARRPSVEHPRPSPAEPPSALEESELGLDEIPGHRMH